MSPASALPRIAVPPRRDARVALALSTLVPMMTPVAVWTICVPETSPMVAGLKNIELASPLPPAVTPAKEVPCAETLCSRSAKPAASAVRGAMIGAARATAAAAVKRRFLSVKVDMVPPTNCVVDAMIHKLTLT